MGFSERTVAICLTGTVLAGVPGIAAAQSQDRASQAASAGVSDIIVTAQRREEALQDVPISITAISGDTLEKANIVNIRDVQSIAPSLKVSSTGVFMQLSIRGITSTALGPGIENNIAVYVDGFYQPSSTSLGGDLANVANLQILKGPQGTLYGRNATGGALLVTTREPSADELIVDGDIGFGNLDDFRARAYVGVPLAEGLSFGVGGYFRQNDGYVRDVDGSHAAPYENWEVRTKLKYEPSTDLSFVLGYNHVWKDDGTTYAYGMQDNLWLSADNPLFGGYPVPSVGPLWTDKVGVSSVDVDPINSTNLDEITFKAIWRSDLGTLSSYTSYADEDFHVDVDFDGTKLPHQHYDAWWLRKTFTQSLDFQTSPMENLDLIVGGMYYHDNATQLSDYFYGSAGFDVAFGGPVMLQAGDTEQRTRGWAAYADATWQVVENLFVNAGIRYSKDKRTIESYVTGSQLQPNAPYPILRAPITSKSFDSWTPRFTVRYEVTPDVNVYASYSQGFKSGVFNSTGSDAFALTNPVNPEKVDAFEIGVKGARSGLYFDAAAYYYDYKDLQVNAVTTFYDEFLGVERTATLLTNAATAEIYGAEASLNAAVSEQFNVRFGVAYTHARYKNFDDAPITIEIAPGRNGATTQDSSGLRIARAPDWTFNIGGDYTIPVGNGEIVLAANGYYSSKFAPSSEAVDPVTGSNLFYQNGYFQANATADWHLPGDNATIGFWVNNITDQDYKIIDTASNVGTWAVLSAPRTYGVKLGFKY